MAEAVLEIDIETKQAIKDMAKFQKTSVKSVKAIQSSFSLLQAAAGLAVGVIAGQKLAGAIGSVTEAASIQEDAINELNTALKISGEFSQSASQDMQDFASSIQQTTKFGDEAILQQLSLAKAFGASNEQAKSITEAAVELASATGKSLNEATAQVSKTLGGFAGELGEVNPAIKALTKEQLAAGDAAKILIEQYGGSAAAQVNTFSGALQQTQNTFGDLQEELGFLITRNPIVIKGIKVAGEAFGSLIKIVSENRAEIGAFVGRAFKGIVNAIPGIIKGFKFLFDAFKGIGLAASSVIIVVADFVKALLSVDVVRDVFNGVIDGFKSLAGGAIAAFSVILDGLSALGVDVGDFQKSVDDLGITLIESVGNDAAAEVTSSLDAMRESALQFGTDTELAFVDVDKAIEVVADTAQTVADEVNKIDFSKEITAAVGADVKAVVGPSFFDTVGKAIEAVFGDIDGKKVGIGFVQNALKGAEGARGAIKSTFSAIGENLLPGFGGAIGEITGELTKGPEHVRNMIDQFVDALPILVEAMAEALPVVIERLAEKSGEIIAAMVNAAPNVVLAIIRNIPSIISAVIRSLPEIVRALTLGLVENIAKQVFQLKFDQEKLKKIIADIGKAVGGFFKGFLELPSRFLKIIGDGLRKIVDKLNPVSGAKNIAKKGGDILDKGLDLIGLQTGGTVPKGFPNDTFPASLTSGELVVPKDDVTRLKRFLDNQGSGGDSGGINSALLSQIASALEQPMQVSTTAEVDGEALAEIILNLSRQNARTAA